MLQNRRIITREALYPAATRCLSNSKETENEETMATVTFTDDASAEHPKDSSSSNDETIDASEFTQEIKIVMPDMGESTGMMRVLYVVL
jgi:hypothetical protein